MQKSFHVLSHIGLSSYFINHFLHSSQYKTTKDNPFNDQLKQAIEQLYKKYVISDDVGLSTHSMLQAIESKIQSLFNIIEQMNPTDIVEAEKVKVS